MTAEFFQARQPADLAAHLRQNPIPHARNQLYGTIRLDDEDINHPHTADFRHCTFANVSFYKVRMDHVHFVDCVFLSCYFRRSDLHNCTFIGCRFIDCNFPEAKLTMERCAFNHSIFLRCFVPVSQGRYNLPIKEHNLRAELATNWAIEAEQAAATDEARTYRRIAAEANEKVLWQKAWADADHYRDHTSFDRRVRALYDWGRSRINHYLWGYGDQAWRPATLYVVLALAVFPLLFLLSREGLAKAGGGQVGWLDATFLSMATILNNSSMAAVSVHSTWTRTLAAVETLTGLIFVGLLITLLFRWILRR